MKIAFIGTGVMGAPMARHLSDAGHDVCVFNRTRAKAEATGLTVADTPAVAAKDCDAVVTCVGNDADLEAVTLGADGAFAAMRDDAVFIDHTTVSAAIEGGGARRPMRAFSPGYWATRPTLDGVIRITCRNGVQVARGDVQPGRQTSYTVTRDDCARAR